MTWQKYSNEKKKRRNHWSLPHSLMRRMACIFNWWLMNKCMRLFNVHCKHNEMQGKCEFSDSKWFNMHISNINSLSFHSYFCRVLSIMHTLSMGSILIILTTYKKCKTEWIHSRRTHARTVLIQTHKKATKNKIDNLACYILEIVEPVAVQLSQRHLISSASALATIKTLRS